MEKVEMLNLALEKLEDIFCAIETVMTEEEVKKYTSSINQIKVVRDYIVHEKNNTI